MLRYVGLFFGLVLGGGIGHPFWCGLLGYFLGKSIDRLFTTRVVINHHRQTSADFTHSFLILCAEVMKADNVTMRSELDYVKSYLLQQLGVQGAQAALLDLREILKEDHDLDAVCAEIRQSSTIHERLMTLQFLFGVAQADGSISTPELQTIERIAQLIGISRMDYESVKSMYMGGYYQYQGGYNYGGSSQTQYKPENLDNDYKILEITPDATDEEVKKAFRTLAKKHHPDKVAHLGDDVRKAAEEKFARLNQAYERIKKARGMN